MGELQDRDPRSTQIIVSGGGFTFDLMVGFDLALVYTDLVSNFLWYFGVGRRCGRADQGE